MSATYPQMVRKAEREALEDAAFESFVGGRPEEHGKGCPHCARLDRIRRCIRNDLRKGAP